jgi:hypothetical protein
VSNIVTGHGSDCAVLESFDAPCTCGRDEFLDELERDEILAELEWEEALEHMDQ